MDECPLALPLVYKRIGRDLYPGKGNWMVAPPSPNHRGPPFNSASKDKVRNVRKPSFRDRGETLGEIHKGSIAGLETVVILGEQIPFPNKNTPTANTLFEEERTFLHTKKSQRPKASLPVVVLPSIRSFAQKPIFRRFANSEKLPHEVIPSPRFASSLTSPLKTFTTDAKSTPLTRVTFQKALSNDRKSLSTGTRSRTTSNASKSSLNKTPPRTETTPKESLAASEIVPRSTPATLKYWSITAPQKVTPDIREQSNGKDSSSQETLDVLRQPIFHAGSDLVAGSNVVSTLDKVPGSDEPVISKTTISNNQKQETFADHIKSFSNSPNSSHNGPSLVTNSPSTTFNSGENYMASIKEVVDMDSIICMLEDDMRQPFVTVNKEMSLEPQASFREADKIKQSVDYSEEATIQDFTDTFNEPATRPLIKVLQETFEGSSSDIFEEEITIEPSIEKIKRVTIQELVDNQEKTINTEVSFTDRAIAKSFNSIERDGIDKAPMNVTQEAFTYSPIDIFEQVFTEAQTDSFEESPTNSPMNTIQSSVKLTKEIATRLSNDIFREIIMECLRDINKEATIKLSMGIMEESTLEAYTNLIKGATSQPSPIILEDCFATEAPAYNNFGEAFAQFPDSKKAKRDITKPYFVSIMKGETSQAFTATATTNAAKKTKDRFLVTKTNPSAKKSSSHSKPSALFKAKSLPSSKELVDRIMVLDDGTTIVNGKSIDPEYALLYMNQADQSFPRELMDEPCYSCKVRHFPLCDKKILGGKVCLFCRKNGLECVSFKDFSGLKKGKAPSKLSFTSGSRSWLSRLQTQQKISGWLMSSLEWEKIWNDSEENLKVLKQGAAKTKDRKEELANSKLKLPKLPSLSDVLGPDPRVIETELDLAHYYLMVIGYIPNILRRSYKCSTCMKKKFHICDWKIQGRKGCTFCQRYKLTCELDMPLFYNSGNLFKRLLKDMRVIDGVTIATPEGDSSIERQKDWVAILPEELCVDSTVLDSLHRAISHHIQVHKNFYNEDCFRIFDPHLLLAFGFLAEEIIREQIMEFFEPKDQLPLVKNEKSFEFMDYVSSRRDPRVSKRLKQWIRMAECPPIPPYMQFSEEPGESGPGTGTEPEPTDTNQSNCP